MSRPIWRAMRDSEVVVSRARLVRLLSLVAWPLNEREQRKAQRQAARLLDRIKEEQG